MSELKITLDRLPIILKAIRAKADLTEHQMARLFGIRASTVADFESGTKTPSLEILAAMGKEFEFEVSLCLNTQGESKREVK